MSEPDLHQITLHGHEVVYRRSGSGPALLLVHGIAGSSRAWREVMPLMSDRFTLVAPDLPGYGRSADPMGDYSLGAYASVLRDLLGALGIDRATVVGQSFGGGVALQLAYQHPELCERLVLVDAGGLGREVTLILRLLSLPGAEYLMPALFPTFVGRWGNAVSRFLFDRGVRIEGMAEGWRAYASLTESAKRHAFAKTLRAVIDPGGQTVSALDRLYLAAHLPTLIVWGDRDSIIPVRHAYDAHEAIPGSRLEVLEGVGHFPHVEAPARFVATLTEFIADTAPVTLDPLALRSLLTAHG